MPDKTKSDFSDLLNKILTPLIAVVGVLIGIWQFTSNIEHNDELEFKRNLWEKRLESYSQLSELVGKIITQTSNDKIFDSLAIEFEQVYWAKLPLIEDKQVEKSMIKFQAELHDFKNKESTLDDLRTRSYLLINDCKKSLFSSWQDIYHE